MQKAENLGESYGDKHRDAGKEKSLIFGQTFTVSLQICNLHASIISPPLETMLGPEMLRTPCTVSSKPRWIVDKNFICTNTKEIPKIHSSFQDGMTIHLPSPRAWDLLLHPLLLLAPGPEEEEQAGSRDGEENHHRPPSSSWSSQDHCSGSRGLCIRVC